MRKRLLTLMVWAIVTVPLAAVSIWFSSTTTADHNQPYGVEVTTYAGGWSEGADLYLYRGNSSGGTYLTGTYGYGSFSAYVSQTDSGPQTVEYYGEVWDYSNYDWGSTMHWVTVSGPADQAPFGVADYADSTVSYSGNLNGNGWAVDPEMGAPISRVDILVDGNDVGDANLGGDRWDVADAYGRSDYRYSGFGFSWNTAGLGVGSHSLEFRAWDNQGNSGTFGYRNFNISSSAPSISLVSPSSQTINIGTALYISSNATDPDGDIASHNLDIQRPNGTWNWESGAFASGEPFQGGPVGSSGNSTRSAWFTFDESGTWYVRSWVSDSTGANLHSSTVAIYVNANQAPTISWHTLPPTYPNIGANFSARATGTDGDGNLTQVTVQISTNGGAWIDFAVNGGGSGSSNTSDANTVSPSVEGTTYQFRAISNDGAGLNSGFIYSPVITVNRTPSVSLQALDASKVALPIGGNGRAQININTNYYLRVSGSDPDGRLAVAYERHIPVGGAQVNTQSNISGASGYYDFGPFASGSSAGLIDTWAHVSDMDAGAYTTTGQGWNVVNGPDIDVNKLSQSGISITSASTFVYGNTYSSTASGGSGTGALNWALGIGSTVSGAAIDANTGAITANSVGTIVIKVRRLGDASYNDSAWSPDFSITVGSRPITITLTGSKVYDGTTTSTGASASVTSGSLASGDSLSLGYAATSSMVAGGYSGLATATITNGTAPTTRTGNYAISYTGSYSITTRAITVTLSGSKVYDGTTSSTNALAELTSGSLAAGDSIGYAYAATSGVLVGSYANLATASVNNAGAPTNRSGSYAITYTGNYTITARPITITMSGSKNYSGTTASANAAASITAGTLAAGDSIGYVYAATSSPVAGTYSNLVTATVSNASAPTTRTSQYAISYAGTYTINKAALTVSPNSVSKVYGAAVPIFTPIFSGFVNSETSAVLTGTPSFSTSATTGSPVGSYTIVTAIGTLSSPNYQFNLVNATLSVTKATLSIAATSYSRAYGAANPTLTFEPPTGFVNGDTTAVISGAPNLATTATVTSAVTAYPITITAGTLSATNYQFNLVNGLLTVTKASLTATADNKSRVTGTANPTFTISYSGFLNGDTPAAITVPIASTSATPSSPVGSYAITLSGGSATNYNITNFSGTLSVTTGVPVITFSNLSRIYGNAPFTLTSSTSGDNGSPTYTIIDRNVAGTAQDNISGWTRSAATLQSSTETDPLGGANATRVALTTAASGPGVGWDTYKQYTGLTVGQTYTFSVAVKLGTATNLAIIPNNTSAWNTVTGGRLVSVADGLSNSQYTRVSVTFVAPTTGKVNIHLGRHENVDTAQQSAGTVYFWGAHLETGSAAGSLPGEIASVSGSTLTITGAGQTYLRVSYPAGVNYAAATQEALLTVSKATLTIAADNLSKSINTVNPALTWTASGYVNSDSSTVLRGAPTISTTATTGSGAGTYPITITAGTLAANNYQFDFVNGTLTVNKLVPVITWSSPSAITYGTPLSATQLNATASVPGTFTYSPALGAVMPVGTNTLDVTFTPTDTATYAVVTPGIAANTRKSIVVNKAILNVSSVLAARAYGAANPTFSPAFTGFVNGDTGSAISGTPGFSTTAVPSSPLGSYPVTVTAGTLAAANYQFTYTNGTLTVGKATLTITANNLSKIYGATVPTLTFTPTGFVNGENAAVLSGSPALSTTATAGSPVGSYPITVAAGTLAATNYQFTFVNGSMAVNKATLTVTVNNATKIYGAANPSFSAVLSGFVNGDTTAVVTGTPSLTTTATTASPVGNYAITGAIGSLAATNYQFTFVHGQLAINKATLTVSALAASRIYGASNPAFVPTYTGWVNGDTVSVLTGQPSLTTTASATSPVPGPYAITVAAGTLAASNYQFMFTNGVLTLTRATLNVSAAPTTRNYGANNPTFTPSYSGFLNGDTTTVLTGAPTLSTVATPTSNVGSYTITATAGTLAATNYQFGFTSGTLTINKAIPNATFANKTRSLSGPNYTVVAGDLDAAYANPFNPGTVAGPTGTIAYAVVTPVGTVVAGTSLPGGSALTVRASHPGDANYLPATIDSVWQLNYVDSDSDGLPDYWEQQYLGTLAYAGASTPFSAFGVTRTLTQSFTQSLSPLPAAAVTTGLRAWYRADLGITKDGANNVSQWLDASGGGRHLTQANAALQPLWVDAVNNGKPAIDFGAGELMQTLSSDLHGGGNDLTLVAVIIPAATQSSAVPAIVDFDAAGQSGFSFRKTATNYALRSRNQAQTAWEGETGALLPLAPSVASVAAFIKNGTTQTAYLNAASQGTATVSSAMHKPTAALALGASISTPTSYFNGRIVEVYVYNRALSPTERQQVEAALASKYILPLDSDGDGLPDDWEYQRYGHLGYGANDDPDGNGYSNAKERAAELLTMPSGYHLIIQTPTPKHFGVKTSDWTITELANP